MHRWFSEQSFIAYFRKICAVRLPRARLDGIALDSAAQVAGMGVTSGAIALDSEAAKRLAAPGHS